MNFKKQAEKLENLLQEEFKKKAPILVLPDNSIVYKTFKIKRNNSSLYDLTHISGDVIESFKLKVTAILAARFYGSSRYDRFKQIKNLDTEYWTNSIDSSVFHYRYKCSNDQIKKDIFAARWQLTRHRAENNKEEITRMFKYYFG